MRSGPPLAGPDFLRKSPLPRSNRARGSGTETETDYDTILLTHRTEIHMPTNKTAKQSAAEAKRAATEAKKQAAAAKAEAAAARVAKFGGGHAAGFMNFIREQGVIGLAVGLAVGAAAGASVKAIVDNFINPIVAFMLGDNDLSSIIWDTGLTNGDVELTFGIGAIINSLIVLVSTALVVYLVVHGAKLDKLDKKK